MPDIRSDKAVQQIRAGDEQGIALLYDIYGSRLLGIIRGVVGDLSAAEEVLQETFLKVWENIASFDDRKASVYTWMVVIARNTAIDLARLKGFQRHKKTEELDPLVHTQRLDPETGQALDVARLLATLDQKYREVLDLIYLKGYTHQEAAELTGLPLGTIKTRLRMALLQLRDSLKGEKGLFLAVAAIILLIYIFRSWIQTS